MFSLDTLKAQFQTAFVPFKQHWKTLALTLLIVWIPLWLFSEVTTFGLTFIAELVPRLFALDVADGRVESATHGALFALLAATLGRVGIYFLIEFPLFLMACALSQAVTIVQLRAINERGAPLEPFEAWRKLRPRLAPLVTTSLLASSVTLVSYLFFVLPGIVAGAYLQLAAPLTILENRSGLSALKESARLIHRAAKGFFLVLTAVLIAQWIIQTMATSLFNGALGTLLCNVAFATVYSLYVALIVALHQDTRTTLQAELPITREHGPDQVTHFG
jgi:hypothetical protein